MGGKYALKRKGFVYSLFSVMILVTLGGLLYLNSNNDIDSMLNLNIDEKLRTDELFYFREGAKQDFGRSVYISGRRSIIALVDDILHDGNYTLGVAGDNLATLVRDGTCDGDTLYLMENSSVEDWSANIYDLGQLHRIAVNIDVISSNVTPDGPFSLKFSNEVNVSVFCLIFSIQFNESISSENIIDVGFVEDPFISIESYGYLRQLIKKCNTTKYPYHGMKISDGGSFEYSDNENWTSGRLSFDIDDPDASGKILVVSDIPTGANNASNFFGVVSENASDSSSGLSNYIFGATSALSNLSGLTFAPTIVMTDDEVWSSYIYDELNDSCYFVDVLGPSFLDRLEGNFNTTSKYNVTNETIGIASFISVLELPEELQNAYSSVDFKYYSSSSGKKIKGVTESSPGTDLSLGFLIDDEHISLWNLSGLDYV